MDPVSQQVTSDACGHTVRGRRTSQPHTSEHAAERNRHGLFIRTREGGFLPRSAASQSLYQEQHKVENRIPEKKHKRYNFANKRNG